MNVIHNNMNDLKKFNAFRFCERCDNRFTPEKKRQKVCNDCKIPQGGFNKKRWKDYI